MPNNTPNVDKIPYGYCHCGCGEKTGLAPYDRISKGWVKGKPIQYINHHHSRRPLVNRFWNFVDMRGPDECWGWNGYSLPTGYGQIRDGKTLHAAHRLSYQLHHGPIPEGMEICHRCDNPPCTNPAHLFAGTRSDNMIDMTNKGRGNTDPSWLYRKGEQNSRAKLTEEQVLEIRRLCSGGMMQKDVASKFGVHKGTVGDIVRRKNWKHIP